MSVSHSDPAPPRNVEYSRREPSALIRDTNASHPTAPPAYTRAAFSGSMAKTERFSPAGPVPCQSIPQTGALSPPSSVIPEPYHVATYTIEGLDGATATL